MSVKNHTGYRRMCIMDFENLKKEVFKKYKESFISTQEATTKREDVFKKTLLNAGLHQDDVQRYYEVFMNSGTDDIKALLEQEHPNEYAEISKKQHEFNIRKRSNKKYII